MLNKKRHLIFLFLMCTFAIIFFVNLQVVNVLRLPENIVIASGDIEYINQNKVLGSFINASLTNHLKQTSAGSANVNYIPTVKFKLFNLIPIKTQKVKLLSDNEVLAGGNMIGFTVDCEGAMVLQNNSGNQNIFEGDILIKINGEGVSGIKGISEALAKFSPDDKAVKLTLTRDGKEIEVEHIPIYDNVTNTYKLGFWIKSDAMGIGTLTFVTKDNRFGALGHPILETGKSVLKAKTGKIYKCNVVGINKGKNGIPGEIRALFLHGKNSEGTVDKSSKFGVYGWLCEDSSLTVSSDVIEIGGRLTASPGKAQILCSLDGEVVKPYEIEIVKTNYQNYDNDKSMVIKITDERLLDKTGGIVQGMSGSPILQKGKIIGAVTHVFINDSTRGFGVYIDWMINE